LRFFHHARQTEHPVLAARLAAGAPFHRTAIRLDHSTHRAEDRALVSRSVAPHSLLRRQKDLRLIFLTNNFLLPALTIAELYRARWRVELFFRWIKQHLHIKSFVGTSENAVKTQVWVAITIYVLVAIVKKQAHWT
jgi:IS4 transposase